MPSDASESFPRDAIHARAFIDGVNLKMPEDEAWEYVPKIGEFYYLTSVPGEKCFRVTAVDEVARTVNLQCEDSSAERTQVSWDDLSDEPVN